MLFCPWNKNNFQILCSVFTMTTVVKVQKDYFLSKEIDLCEKEMQLIVLKVHFKSYKITYYKNKKTVLADNIIIIALTYII